MTALKFYLFCKTSILIAIALNNTGAPTYNWPFSELCTIVMLDFLFAKGIEKERLVSVGKGANNPTAGNHTKEGRYQNRRVEFRTIGSAFIKQKNKFKEEEPEQFL